MAFPRYTVRLKEIRLAKHLTVAELSERSRVGKATISRIENGGDALLSSIIALIAVLDVSIDELIVVDFYKKDP